MNRGASWALGGDKVTIISLNGLMYPKDFVLYFIKKEEP